ncbi:MAG: cell envelope integrity protein TolA, partial [Pseudomonadota bacterium]
ERLAKARAEAERKRKAEEERKRREREAAAQRARDAQEARKREEAERALQDMLAAEDRARDARAAGLEDLYKLQIKQKIQRNWNPPPLSGSVSCELRVRQLRTGDLHSIERVDCNGNAPLERSLQAAAERASPFPRPDDPSLFDPLLIFKLNTDD